MRPIFLRQSAEADIEMALIYYQVEGGIDLMCRFREALGDAEALVRRYPALGATRYSQQLNITGLRTWTLPRFPYSIFYFDTTDGIDVWRVLHTASDIPAWLRDPAS